MPTTSTPKKRLLFVCMGNICRSPAAECVMRKYLEREGLSDRVECDSAGTIGYHEGNKPDKRMQRAGGMRGFAIKGSARQVTREDFKNFDLILAMDDENMRDLRAFDPENVYDEKLKFFCDYLTEHRAMSVPDPYYGGDDGFESVLDLLEDGCASLVEEVKKQLADEAS
ncbi:MAG: low molecular weight protein-tyrosine-phosphatase [Verrucomicrobiales bacterium]